MLEKDAETSKGIPCKKWKCNVLKGHESIKKILK